MGAVLSGNLFRIWKFAGTSSNTALESMFSHFMLQGQMHVLDLM